MSPHGPCLPEDKWRPCSLPLPQHSGAKGRGEQVCRGDAGREEGPPHPYSKGYRCLLNTDRVTSALSAFLLHRRTAIFFLGCRLWGRTESDTTEAT